MSTEQLPELNKISRVAKVLLPFLYFNMIASWLIGMVAILMLVFNASAEPCSQLFPHIFPIRGVKLTLGVIQSGVTIHEALLLGIGICILILIAFHGFYNGINLAKCFVKHGVFSVQNTGYIKKVAMAYTIYFLLFVIGEIVMRWSLFGWEAIEIVGPLNSSIMLGIVWLIVWIMQAGEALHSENKMTI